MTSYEELYEENRLLREQLAAAQRTIAEYSAPQHQTPELVSFATFFEAFPIPLVMFDADGVAVAMNASNERLLGVSRDKVIGTHNIFADPQSHTMGYTAAFEEALHTGTTVKMLPTSYDVASSELGNRGVGHGNTIWSETTYVPLCQADGSVCYILEINADVTQQMVAEQSMQRNNDMFRTILDSIDSLIYVADIETHELLFVNKYGQLAFGDVGTKYCWEYLQVGKTGPCEFCNNKQLLDDEGMPTGIHRWEFQNTLNNRWYDVRDQAIQWVDGRYVRFEIASDVHDIKMATEQLRMYETLVAHAPDGIMIGNNSAGVTHSNSAFNMLLATHDARGMHTHEFIVPSDQELLADVSAQLSQGKSWYGTLHHQRTDGSMFPGLVTIFPLFDAAGDIIGQAAIVRDTTQQQQTQQELRTFYTMVEKSPDGITLLAMNGTITYANAAFYQLHNYDTSVIGLSMLQFIADDDASQADNIQAAIMNDGTWQGIIYHKRKDGVCFPVMSSVFVVFDVQGNPSSIAIITRDMSDMQQAEEERLALQERIIQAQKNTLRELSTPLMPLADNLVAMPLVGTIDTERAQQVMEVLLEGIATYQADYAILDITGVLVVDTQVANALIQTAQAVQLLGSRVVLTGISPVMAQTLVSLGADMSSIITRATLQRGIAYVMEQIRDMS